MAGVAYTNQLLPGYKPGLRIQIFNGAGDGIRTRDPQLGRLTL